MRGLRTQRWRRHAAHSSKPWATFKLLEIEQTKPWMGKMEFPGNRQWPLGCFQLLVLARCHCLLECGAGRFRIPVTCTLPMATWLARVWSMSTELTAGCGSSQLMRWNLPLRKRVLGFRTGCFAWLMALEPPSSTRTGSLCFVRSQRSR